MHFPFQSTSSRQVCPISGHGTGRNGFKQSAKIIRIRHSIAHDHILLASNVNGRQMHSPEWRHTFRSEAGQFSDCQGTTEVNWFRYSQPHFNGCYKRHQISTNRHAKLYKSGSADRYFNGKHTAEEEQIQGTVWPWRFFFLWILNASLTHHSINRVRLLQISTKSDVWSLGCIFYLSVYRRTPFSHIKQFYAKFSTITSPDTVIDYPTLPIYYPPMLAEVSFFLKSSVNS